MTGTLDDPRYAKYRKRPRSEKSVMRCSGCGGWVWKPRVKKQGCPTCNLLSVDIDPGESDSTMKA